jgi:hypothetical protein
VTRNPSAPWIVQQLREARPYAVAHKFLLFDRDSKFARDVVSAAREMGSQPMRTAFRSPWQNGVAERWVGSCRRDLLDHVIVLNERHLKRLMAEYVRYYHADRTHLGLTKDTPAGRPIAIRPQGKGTIRWVPSTRWATPSLCGVDQRLSSRRTPRLPVHSSTRIKSHVENSYRLSNAGGLLLVCLSTEGYDELQGFIGRSL